MLFTGNFCDFWHIKKTIDWRSEFRVKQFSKTFFQGYKLILSGYLKQITTE